MQKLKFFIGCGAVCCMALCAACAGAHENLPKVFRYNESKGIPTLDPAFARTQAIINPCMQLHCGLLQYDSALNVQPCIAHSFTIDKKALTYIFHLRRDVYFHSSPAFAAGRGRRVAAQDFVYTFYRLKNPKTASPGSWTMAALDTCRAIDDSTLLVQLKQPSPVFLSILAMPYCFVVPQEAVEFYGNDFGKHPVGAGPFYLKAWREGEKLVMRRNPRYFERDRQGRALPYLEAVSIVFIPDKQSEFLEFVKGKIDYLSGVHPASRDELLLRNGTLNPKYAGSVQMLQGNYFNTEYIGILIDTTPFAEPALQNVDLRRKIALNIHREEMVQYLRSNMATPAHGGFVPAGLPGGLAQTAAGLQIPPPATEPPPPPVLSLSTTDDYLDICEFIQHELEEAGIRVRINVLSGAAYRQQVAEGKLSMFRASWIADYPDAESYLSLLYSANRAPSGPNYTHFCNPRYDALYRAAIAEADPARRLQLYREMDKIAMEQAVIIPLFYDKVTRFVRRGIRGMQPNAMNMLVLKQVSI